MMVLDDSAVRCRIENGLGRTWCCWRACMHRHVRLRTLCTVVNVCACVCISVFVHLLRIYVNMRACTPTHSPTNARTGIETARGGSGGAAHAVPGCRNPRTGDMSTPVWIHLRRFTYIHLCIDIHIYTLINYVCVCLCVCVRACVCVCVCLHGYVYLYI